MHLKTTTLISGLFLFICLPAQALDLSGGVSVGGLSAGAGASVGHGSTASASVSLGLGGTDASVEGNIGKEEADTPVAENPGGPGAEPHGGRPGETRDPALMARFIGRDVISSDGVVLGQIYDIRPGEGSCPALGVEVNPILKVAHERVWLKTGSCGAKSGAIRISANSRAFVKSMTY